MFNLSSLVSSLSPWRCTIDQPQHEEQTSAAPSVSTHDNNIPSLSAQDIQACDAHLDDFLESMSGEFTLIDLACHTDCPSPLVT